MPSKWEGGEPEDHGASLKVLSRPPTQGAMAKSPHPRPHPDIHRLSRKHHSEEKWKFGLGVLDLLSGAGM